MVEDTQRQKANEKQARNLRPTLSEPGKRRLLPDGFCNFITVCIRSAHALRFIGALAGVLWSCFLLDWNSISFPADLQ